MSDALILTYPWRLYNAETLSRQEIPFWNPYIFAGYPHLAALQSHAIYPLTAVFDLWDPVAGIAWSMALHLALAGTLMFLFLCRLRVGLAAAVLGGVIFELNGFFMVRMGAPSYVFSGIWAPFLLLGIEDLFRQGSWRSSWKVVLATCFCFLGGHPQIFVLVMLMGGGYVLLLAGREWRRRPLRVLTGRLVKVGTAVVFGLGLAGAQLLPFLELVRETGRRPVEFSSYQKLALPPVILGQALVPDLFGHPVDRSYWLLAAERFVDDAPEARGVWEWNYTGENLFTGVAPLVLALLALLRPRSRLALFFGALAAFSLLVVFGAPGVLRGVYELMPTFQHSRSDRIIYLYMVAVCVMASLGWASATGWRPDKPLPRAASRLAPLLIVLPVLPELARILISAEERAGYRQFWAFARGRLREQSDVLVPQALAAAGIAVAIIGLLIVVKHRPRSRRWAWCVALILIVVPLYRFGWSYNPVQQPPFLPASSIIDRLHDEVGELDRIARVGAGAFPANVGQTLGFFDVHGASAAALASYVRLIQSAEPEAINKNKYFRAFRDPAILDLPLLDFLGVGLILGDRSLSLPPVADLPPRLAFGVYRNPTRLPRFFLVDRVETYETVDQGIRRLLSPDFEPRRIALVATSDRDVTAASTPGTSDLVRVLSYGAHRIDLEVSVANDRLLVSSEVDYPGWQVEIDGAKGRKLLVNTAFRGALVPAGRHRVGFRFVPRSFYLGVAITLLSVTVWSAFAAAERRRHPKTKVAGGA